jgi:hypothetical protein
MVITTIIIMMVMATIAITIGTIGHFILAIIGVSQTFMATVTIHIILAIQVIITLTTAIMVAIIIPTIGVIIWYTTLMGLADIRAVATYPLMETAITIMPIRQHVTTIIVHLLAAWFVE